MSRITQQELESYLWGAAVLLRGLIDAGDYKQFIFPLLFYKRVSDVWEEEYQAALANSNGDLTYAQFGENHRFQIPAGAHWNDVRQTSKNVGAVIQKAMRAIESANPDLLDGIFGDAPWTNRERLPDETLKNLIEHFSTQTLSVGNVPEDELGNAYEYPNDSSWFQQFCGDKRAVPNVPPSGYIPSGEKTFVMRQSDEGRSDDSIARGIDA